MYAFFGKAYNSPGKPLRLSIGDILKIQVSTPIALALVTFVLSLQGCAHYGPSTDWYGKSRFEVVERLGPPARQATTDTGVRLAYARGPYGRHTYFLEFDANDKLVRWQQVLTEQEFQKIIPGMTATAVEDLIGPSFEKTTLGRQRGEVWSYRFETPFCIWFQVEIDQSGVVRSAGHGIPPECARDDDWLSLR